MLLNFPQELLCNLGKSIITWYRKVRIEFRLLRLNLESDNHENFSPFLNSYEYLWFFKVGWNCIHVLSFTGWSSNLRLEFDWLVVRILQICLLRNCNPLNLFSDGIKFINFRLKKLRIWFFKQCCAKLRNSVLLEPLVLSFPTLTLELVNHFRYALWVEVRFKWEYMKSYKP